MTDLLIIIGLTLASCVAVGLIGLFLLMWCVIGRCATS